MMLSLCCHFCSVGMFFYDSVVLHTSAAATKDKCIDIPGYNDTIGQFISQYDCIKDVPAQIFTITPLTLTNATDANWVNLKSNSRLCFEVNAGDMTVKLNTCDNTQMLQHFAYENGRFRNRQYPEKCLESKDNGAPILLLSCSDSAANQTFAATAKGGIS